MCLAKIATFPDCGHIRVTVEACDFILSLPLPPPRRPCDYESTQNISLDEWSEIFSQIHPKPMLTIHIQDPKGSVCLCQHGIEMIPKHDTEYDFSAAVALYRNRRHIQTDLPGFRDIVINPTLEWLENRHRGTKTIDVPVVDTKMPIPDLALNGREKLYNDSIVMYDGYCWHINENNPEHRVRREISSIPLQCAKCPGRLKRIGRVINVSIMAIPKYERPPEWEITLY